MRMDQAGSRSLIVVDADNQGFNERTLGAITGLSTVTEAGALGTPFDATNGVVGSGGARIPVWPLLGDATTVVRLVSGRLPRRRDLGRRRTLGITRADLIAIVAGRAGLTAFLGTTLGGAIGLLANYQLGIHTPIDFAVAIGILATLTAITAAVPPAVYAARLDPVAVMRTP